MQYKLNRNLIVCISLLLISLSNCKNHDSDRMNQALKRAGQNRSELEKVLSHYRSDSLRYKAACFLIENMQNKFSYRGEQYDAFLTFNDSISALSTAVSDDYKSFLEKYYKKNHTLVGSPDTVYDIENITADYLIRNIDQAFKVYKHASWTTKLSFDDFCEYILPYRIGNEPLTYYRDSLYDTFNPFHNKGNYTLQEAADSVLKESSHQTMELMTYPDFVPEFQPRTLLKIKAGTCREYSNLATYIMRSVGIPVTTDFTPQWPHRGQGHSWSALITGKDSAIDFEGSGSSKVGGHLKASKSFRMAKAYRNMYGIQLNDLAMIHQNEFIPEFFQNPNLKDVTSQYIETTDITTLLPKNLPVKRKYAYLCVFDNKKWTPIQWGAIKHGQVIFPAMGKTAIYLPIIYNEKNQPFPIDYPILVDSNGKINHIIPDENNTRSITLNRKYPVFDWWNTRTMVMVGGRFQAANRPDFSDSVNLFVIRNTPEMTYQTIDLSIQKKYKFYRYRSPDSHYGNVAEVEFYDENNKILTGKIIGTRVKLADNAKERAFDGDPLTYFHGDTSLGNWVGLQLKTPKKISRIRFLCQNDDNFIKNNENYELYYWADGDWKSLGQLVGDNSQILVYHNAPDKALFLLKNHTKGKEERIFTYQQGKQIWW